MYGHAASRLASQRAALTTVSRTESADEWTTDGVTLTEVASITTDDLPVAYDGIPANRLTPFAFSNLGPHPGEGTTMLKAEATAAGTFHAPIDAASFDPADAAILFYGWRDHLSADTTGTIELLLYTGTPGAEPYWRVTLPTTSFGYPGGTWEAVSHPISTTVTPAWEAVGSPASKVVTGIGFRLTPETDQTVRFYLSGIYRVPNTRTRGAIMLDFDDSLLSQYEKVFPIMTAAGYRGSIGVVGSSVEAGLHQGTIPAMTKANMLEMDAAGWDMVSHSWSHLNMASITDAATRLDEIKLNHEWLAAEGVRSGRRFYVAPFNGHSWQGEEVIRRYHDMGRGPASNNLILSPALRAHGLHTVSGSASNLAFWTNRMALAEATKGVVNIHMHGVDDASFQPMTEAFFTSVVAAIADYDIDVITWSDLYAESLG